MFVPVTEIAPVAATAARSICPPLTVRLASAVAPPAAPCRFTAAVSASRVSAKPPSIVEVKVIEPSVPSSSASLSTDTAAVARVTAPVKLMLPSSLS